MGKTKTLDDLETEVRAFDRSARVPCLRRPIPLFAPPFYAAALTQKAARLCATFMRPPADLRPTPRPILRRDPRWSRRRTTRRISC